MFLTNENKIKWKWLLIASVVTLVLVLTGIFWYDKPLFLFLRNFDGLWANAINIVFDWKNWIILAGVATFVVYVKKTVNTTDSVIKRTKWFNIKARFLDFVEKTKTSYAFFIFCSVFGTGVAVKLLKTFIGRARPIFFEALNMTGFYPPSTEWAFNSMPSGHTAVSFAGLVMIGLLAPKYKWLTWSLAIVVGASRVCAGAHWPTDILLGAFVGMVFADFAKSAICSRI